MEVRDEFGSITSSNATLTVLVGALIVKQPQPQAACRGIPPLSVSRLQRHAAHWLSVVPCAGTTYTNIVLYTTNCTFTIPNVQFSDSGNYRVIITNAAATNSSLFVALTVGP